MISQDRIYAFIDWCDATFISQTIQQSLWLFPVIESVHLLGLALLGGAVLVMDARLLNLGLTRQSVEAVARMTWRWLLLGIALMLATGIPLFLSETEKLYNSDSFWVKMYALGFILLLTFTLKRRFLFGGTQGESVRLGWYGGLLGGVSMSAWFVVAAAGRWVGFS